MTLRRQLGGETKHRRRNIVFSNLTDISDKEFKEKTRLLLCPSVSCLAPHHIAGSRPRSETQYVIRFHFRNWFVNDILISIIIRQKLY